jgi:D-aspartate ligase
MPLPIYAPTTPSEGALLFLGDFNGTLATARCLGERGIDVALVDSSPWTVSRASRHVRHFERLPATSCADDFMQWLIDRGRGFGPGRRRANYSGRVLFPASDEQVFLFAKHQAELSRYFRMYLPSFDTIYGILNKQRLYEACVRAGLDYPATWYPRGEAEVREVMTRIHADLMIKPKSQIQFESKIKGRAVPRGGNVADHYLQFVRENHYGPAISAYDDDIVWPMLQAYHSSRTHKIYGLSGFSDLTARPLLMRAAVKVMQSPRDMGVGVCFEAAPVDSALAGRVADLCRDLDYYGIFDIEFIEHNGRFLLIDFNPRAYKQMAFEIARGLPLPYMHYLAALNDRSSLNEVYQSASDWKLQGNEAYCDGLHLSLVNLAQRTNELIGGAKSEGWGSWMRLRKNRLTDAVRQPNDPGPARLDAMRHCLRPLRHPRRWFEKYLRT